MIGSVYKNYRFAHNDQIISGLFHASFHKEPQSGSILLYSIHVPNSQFHSFNILLALLKVCLVKGEIEWKENNKVEMNLHVIC